MKRFHIQNESSIQTELDCYEGSLLGDYIIKCITQGTTPEVVGALEYDDEDSAINDVDPNADIRTDKWDAVEQLDNLQRKQVIEDMKREAAKNSAPDVSEGTDSTE